MRRKASGITYCAVKCAYNVRTVRETVRGRVGMAERPAVLQAREQSWACVLFAEVEVCKQTDEEMYVHIHASSKM